jgi:hypothetical protein
VTTLTVSPFAGPVVARPRLAVEVWADLTWSLTRQRGWLTGLVLNLVLALAYLLVDPLTAGPTQEWAVVVGSYFVVFVLADVSTTNALGNDAGRVHRQLAAGVSLARIMIVKNLTLLLVVGVPTLLATAALTLWSADSSHLVLTLPAVLFPIMVWLGVGNLVSVVLPVRAATLRERWAGRDERRESLRWLASLALPYALCLLVDPVTDVPELITTALHRVLAGSVELPVTVVVLLALAMWGGLTAGSLAWWRHRGGRLA